jgi:hypothetical protein
MDRHSILFLQVITLPTGAIFAHIIVLPPQKQQFKNKFTGAVTFPALTRSILLMSLTI